MQKMLYYLEDKKIANEQFEEKIENLQNILRGKEISKEEKVILLKILEINQEYSKKKDKNINHDNNER